MKKSILLICLFFLCSFYSFAEGMTIELNTAGTIFSLSQPEEINEITLGGAVSIKQMFLEPYLYGALSCGAGYFLGNKTIDNKTWRGFTITPSLKLGFPLRLNNIVCNF